MYADPSLVEKPALLGERGGAYYSEAAVGLIGVAARQQRPAPHAANVRNDGTLPFLADDAVIEVICDVDHAGARPRCRRRPLAAELAGLVAHVSAYEELALDAALRGGRERVYRALLAHPLVGQQRWPTDLTDRLLAANTAHLAWAR